MTVARFDLIFLEQGQERSMSAGVVLEDGSTTMLGPFPFKGAFGPIAEGLKALDPEQFADGKDLQLRLTTVHFRNMARHENAAGQAYPFRLP